MSRALVLPELIDAPPADDPFCYGMREVVRRQPDGSIEVERLPLTIWDFMHPQEEDKLMQGSRHFAEAQYLAGVIKARVRHDPRALVLSDVGVFWDVPGIPNHSPDVTLIFDVRDPQENRSSFHVAWEGVRPALIIEVVSPKKRETREADILVKVKEYHKAMVPLYVIVDREREEDWPTILGYRYAPGAYEAIPLDAHDCLLLEPLGLRLCANQNRITLYDAVTGEELGDYTAITEALEAEIAAHKAEAEARQLAEEQARLAAEERHKAEEKARAAAEEQMKAEEKARAAAEAEKLADDRARAAAEAEKLADNRARAAAEEQKKAEEKARAAAEAEKLADDRARAAAEEQKKAEERALAAAEAQKNADDRARAEADARRKSDAAYADLERRLRDLEQRLQSPPGP